jgi:hypothetical protein
MGCNRLHIDPLSDDDRRGLISKTMKEASKHLTVRLALDVTSFLSFSGASQWRDVFFGTFVVIRLFSPL